MATPTWEQVIAGMIAKLQAITVPKSPGVKTPAQYVQICEEYFGQFETDEALTAAGIAGRCPALLVAFSGERFISTTVGFKVDKVEATFSVLCCVDAQRNTQLRNADMFKLMRDVRYLVGAKALSIDNLAPLGYDGISVVRQAPPVTAWAVRFKTRYRNDYTIDPGPDTLDQASGELVPVHETLPPAPGAIAIAVAGANDGRRYSYRVVAEYADGIFSNASPRASTSSGPNQLALGAANTVAWAPPQAGYGSALLRYHIMRDESEATGGSSATLGEIGTTAAGVTNFDDIGQAGDGQPSNVRAVGSDQVF